MIVQLPQDVQVHIFQIVDISPADLDKVFSLNIVWVTNRLVDYLLLEFLILLQNVIEILL